MDPINEPLRVVPPDAGPWSVVVESDNNNGFMTKTLYKIASISYYDIDRSSCKILNIDSLEDQIGLQLSLESSTVQ